MERTNRKNRFFAPEIHERALRHKMVRSTLRIRAKMWKVATQNGGCQNRPKSSSSDRCSRIDIVGCKNLWHWAQTFGSPEHRWVRSTLRMSLWRPWNILWSLSENFHCTDSSELRRIMYSHFSFFGGTEDNTNNLWFFWEKNVFSIFGLQARSTSDFSLLDFSAAVKDLTMKLRWFWVVGVSSKWN